jgi:hypothetical protein
MHTTTAPDRTEAADYYFTYISQVPDGDVRDILAMQLPETLSLLDGVTEEQSSRQPNLEPERLVIQPVRHLHQEDVARRHTESAAEVTAEAERAVGRVLFSALLPDNEEARAGAVFPA